MDNNIHIGCATDSRFVLQTCVMLYSLFQNNKEHHFTVHLITNDVTIDLKSRIEKLSERYAHDIFFYTVKNENVKDFHVNGHVSAATYFRLFFSEVLDAKIKKMLYLDSDMIVLDDITELWNAELNGCALAAVQSDGHEAIGYPNGYFNAGLLLIDLYSWRKNKISEKAIEFIRNHPDKIHYWDQDALNNVMDSKWCRLDSKWNGFISNYENRPLENDKILHYSGAHKPWSVHYTGPLKNIYLNYQQKYLLVFDPILYLKNQKFIRYFTRFFTKNKKNAIC